MATQLSFAYTILPEQAQEDALHATRLLQVEERPFQRVTRNLLGKDSLLRWAPRQLPSPPPEGAEADAPAQDAEDEIAKRQKFREEILLDFAALESSVVRIQLIQSSNARERERYATEKAKILGTAQAVRDNTMDLRAQLADAQRVLELRKGYDELAAKLMGSQKLNARKDTTEETGKLQKEIEDLEQDSVEFEGVWMGRREGFDKVVAEGQNLVKLIKGIKDDPEPELEKDDAMDEGEEGAKGERSRMGTPAPGGSTPLPDGSTPMPGDVAGRETPMPESADTGVASPMRPAKKFLDVEGVDTRENSRVGSPMAQAIEAQGDVEMAEGEALLEREQTTETQQSTTAERKADMDVDATQQQVSTPAEVMDES